MLLELKAVLGWAILGLMTARAQGFLILKSGDKDSSSDSKPDSGLSGLEKLIQTLSKAAVESEDSSASLFPQLGGLMDCKNNKEDVTTEAVKPMGLIRLHFLENIETPKDDQKDKIFPEKLLGFAMKLKNLSASGDLESGNKERPKFPMLPLLFPFFFFFSFMSLPARLEPIQEESTKLPILPVMPSNSQSEENEISQTSDENPLANLVDKIKSIGDSFVESLPKADSLTEKAPPAQEVKKVEKGEAHKKTVFNIKTMNLNVNDLEGKSIVNSMLNETEILSGSQNSVDATFNIDTLNVGEVDDGSSDEDDKVEGQELAPEVLPPLSHLDLIKLLSIADNDQSEEIDPLQQLKDMLDAGTKTEGESNKFTVDFNKKGGLLILTKKN